MSTMIINKKQIIAEMAALALEGKTSLPNSDSNDSTEDTITKIIMQAPKTKKTTNAKKTAKKDLFIKVLPKQIDSNEDVLNKHLNLLNEIKNRAEKIKDFSPLVESITDLQDAINGMTNPIIGTISKITLTGEYFMNLVDALQPAYTTQFAIPRLDVNNHFGYFQPTKKQE